MNLIWICLWETCWHVSAPVVVHFCRDCVSRSARVLHSCRVNGLRCVSHLWLKVRAQRCTHRDKSAVYVSQNAQYLPMSAASAWLSLWPFTPVCDLGATIRAARFPGQHVTLLGHSAALADILQRTSSSVGRPTKCWNTGALAS